MKTLKILFKVRYIGQQEPESTTELVDVENDSTKEEVESELKDYYYNYYVKGNSKVAETYSPQILTNEKKTLVKG